MCSRVEPTVSRRGTCDRGIWTKPLSFAADAVGYGFCLGVSKIVRLRVGQNGGVGKEGWSFGRGGEVGRGVFGGEMSGGLDWIGVGGDTKGIGVEAPTVESRMDG